MVSTTYSAKVCEMKNPDNDMKFVTTGTTIDEFVQQREKLKLEWLTEHYPSHKDEDEGTRLLQAGEAEMAFQDVIREAVTVGIQHCFKVHWLFNYALKHSSKELETFTNQRGYANDEFLKKAGAEFEKLKESLYAEPAIRDKIKRCVWVTIYLTDHVVARRIELGSLSKEETMALSKMANAEYEKNGQ